MVRAWFELVTVAGGDMASAGKSWKARSVHVAGFSCVRVPRISRISRGSCCGSALTRREGKTEADEEVKWHGEAPPMIRFALGIMCTCNR